jgi:hypothetical protein
MHYAKRGKMSLVYEGPNNTFEAAANLDDEAPELKRARLIRLAVIEGGLTLYGHIGHTEQEIDVALLTFNEQHKLSDNPEPHVLAA